VNSKRGPAEGGVLHLPLPAPGDLVGTIESNPKSSPMGRGGQEHISFNQDINNRRNLQATGGGHTNFSAHIPNEIDLS